MPRGKPEVDAEQFIESLRELTINWARRHDLWLDAWLKDPIDHYNEEPHKSGPLLLLCADGPISSVLEWDAPEAQELRSELDSLGVFIECETRGTYAFHLDDWESELQRASYRLANWRWICRLIEADTADVSGDLYSYFADNPDDVHRLTPREFETLISSIFNARGWKTELGPGSGDGGIDLRIWQSDPIGDLLTLVQIKRYARNRPIRLDAVAALETHVNRQGASRGLFVTSSRYLPGVHRFASPQSRIILADTTDLSRWCAESAQEMHTARNRALALTELKPLLERISKQGKDPRLVVGGLTFPSFCIVLRESKTSALLAHIPSTLFSGDMYWGTLVPNLTGELIHSEHREIVFRAIRKEQDGQVSYWGQRELYHVWDGKPAQIDHWD